MEEIRKVISIFCVLASILAYISCNNPNKAPQTAVSKIDVKSIKPNSPDDEKKIKKSKEMMYEIYKQMNFIPEMDVFINVLNHCKDNHLFVNSDTEGYIIVAVSKKGIKQLPEVEQIKLIDTSSANNAYKLKFLLHHILISPKKTYPGILYRSLSGEDCSISENRSDLQLNDKMYRIQSSLKFSDNLEIIAIDSVLYR